MRSSARLGIPTWWALAFTIATAFAGRSASGAEPGLTRRYGPYLGDRYSDYSPSPSELASRRARDPYTPYYNRPAVWPYYPGYWGWRLYGPYGYRYGLYRPWYQYPYGWHNPWQIWPVAPLASDWGGYGWRVPYYPYEPGSPVHPFEVGAGFPAALTAESAGECYYW